MSSGLPDPDDRKHADLTPQSDQDAQIPKIEGDDLADADAHWSEDEDPELSWDHDDARRQHDQMAPPKAPCECYCLHCGRTFMSDAMWFQKVVGDPQGFEGFWMCPTPNCSGAGFTFDIFPTDPDHPANAGWHFDDEEWDEDDENGETDTDGPSEWSEDADLDGPDDADDAAEEYDPQEPSYRDLDEMLDDDDDLEGEEWKYGLAPGERPEGSEGPPIDSPARADWEAEQQGYDEPDRRPRELDWSDREDRQYPRGANSPDSGLNEDDIPF